MLLENASLTWVLAGTALAALFPDAEVATVLVGAMLQAQSLRSCGNVSLAKGQLC